MDFIRPGARAHWFEQEDTMEWGMCDEEPDEPVSQHPEDWLVPHPSPSACVAPPAEARAAWLAGVWDEGNA